jgi:Fis family transcriptional regulator
MKKNSALHHSTTNPVAESVSDSGQSNSGLTNNNAIGNDQQKHHLTNAPVAQAQTLRDSVSFALNNYFAHLDGQQVTNIYEMVMSEVEAPLFEEVMKYSRNNQTNASNLMGLNRGTLRKKLKQYGLL